MPRQFRFGSDPEFIFVVTRPDGRTEQIGADDSPVSGITNHTGLGEIGRNGCSSTAEIRTNAHPTLDALEREILQIISNGGNALTRLTYPAGRLAMMFGAFPHRVPCGGHIHITSSDPQWFWSKESLQVVPFFISLATYMYDKIYLERIAGSSYGQHGDAHQSPDRDTRATIDVPGGPSLSAWPGGFRGWEYRNPTSWIAPQNAVFRRKLFTAINSVLNSEGELTPPSGEKEKQIRFVGKVCEILGGSIRREIGADSERAYNQYFENAKRGGLRWFGGEHNFLREYFNHPPSTRTTVHFGKLLAAVQQAQSEIHLVGFDEIFNDIVPTDPWRNDNLNPPVTYPMPAPPMPIRLTSFRSMAEAVTALQASYAAFVESTHKGDWVSIGESWYSMFPCKYAMENNVARDLLIPDITHIAMSLCVDAVQRRSLKVKFLPRAPDRSMIYGGGEQRSFSGRSAETMALVPMGFATNPEVQRLMATERFTVAEGPDEHIYLRMSFRESPSDLRYILVALFMLWKQQFIGGAATAKNISATIPWREHQEHNEVTT